MKPDGTTFFVGAVHHTIAPSIYKNLDYDLETVVRADHHDRAGAAGHLDQPDPRAGEDLAEFLDYVKKNPGKVNYASPGAGTAHHLAGELFKLQTKTEITHVPYRGAGPAMQDLLAGNVDMMFDGMGTSAQQIRQGRLIGLATATPQRVAEFPDIPTSAEVGVPSWIVSTWYGVWAIKGTPQPMVDRMYAEIVKAMKDREAAGDLEGAVGAGRAASRRPIRQAHPQRDREVAEGRGRIRSEAGLSTLEEQSSQDHQGRGAVRRGLARPLFDRRVDLPDRAGRRRRAARRGRDRARRSTSRATPTCRVLPRGARHLAVRPDRRRGAGDRLHQAPEQGRRLRQGRARRSRCSPASCSISSTRGCKPHGLWYPGRRLDQRAGDARRHGRQQLVRLALDPLRQHGAQRARASTRCSPTARAARFGKRPGRPREPAVPRASLDKVARASPSREAGRDRAPLPEGAAPGRRLQPRHHLPAVGAALHDRRLGQHGASAGRLAKARSPYSSGSTLEALAAAEAQDAGRVPLPDVLQGDGIAAAHRQAEAGRGRAGRPHDDRPRARQSARSGRSSSSSSDGEPDAILLVEFAGDDARRAARASCKQLVELMGDLGLPGSVVEITDPRCRRDVWEVRKAGLNIMMSMKGDGKPVSFIEDCAVPLEHLAEYTDRLTAGVPQARHARHLVRARLGRHACMCGRSSTCARDGAAKMRAIAEEAAEMVQRVQGRVFGRARRRPGALGMDRAVLRAAAHARVRGDQGRCSTRRASQSRQDRAAVEAWTTATLFRFKPGYQRSPTLDCRLTCSDPALDPTQWGERLRQGRRDVQQQRPLPQVRRRHDVPVVPRHPRRAAPDARPRQHAAARALRPARRRTR